ncbi:MAG: hypothetical protein U5J63_06145 [Fodinibius sp.]|nr:hypothetical protein [Fodinibius sp.]
MKSLTRKIQASLVLAALLVLFRDADLDVTNPNSATEDDVLGSAEGVRAYLIGMQGTYSGDVYADIVLNTGITTREMAINTTFSSLIELRRRWYSTAARK